MLYAIEAINLSKVFEYSTGMFGRFSFGQKKSIKAIDSVSLQIKKGEIFGILGPNGSGKTTLIKLLTTLILPTEGTACVNGYDVVKQEAKVRNSVGLVMSDERSFYWRLTGRQNLEFFAALYKLSFKVIRKKIAELAALLEIEEYIDNFFYNYSSGIRQRFCIARSLLNNPQILFIDEPTRSLDNKSAENLRRFIKEEFLHRQGSTVLFTTLNDVEAVSFSDRLAILDKGQIKIYGTPEQIKRNYGL